MRGWEEVDIILFSADAYVDHPSFGAAVIGRTLEAAGYRVAIVPQPDWHGDFRDFRKLGRPRLFFGIAPGCMDSMVNKYTAARRLRSEDAYSPDGRHDLRPEYPTIVYSQILRQLYPDVPIVLGGIEASLRRLTHYDYWQDRLRPCILSRVSSVMPLLTSSSMAWARNPSWNWQTGWLTRFRHLAQWLAAVLQPSLTTFRKPSI